MASTRLQTVKARMCVLPLFTGPSLFTHFLLFCEGPNVRPLTSQDPIFPSFYLLTVFCCEGQSVRLSHYSPDPIFQGGTTGPPVEGKFSGSTRHPPTQLQEPKCKVQYCHLLSINVVRRRVSSQVFWVRPCPGSSLFSNFFLFL